MSRARKDIMHTRIARLAPALVVPALAATVAVATAAPANAAGAEEFTVSTGTIFKAIPDQDAVSQKLVVKKAGKIKDVNVSFAAEHNVIADLSFFLESPTGRLVHLTSGNGGIGDGYGSQNVDGCGSTTTFNDEADVNVRDFEGVNTTFSGPYQPESRQLNQPTTGLSKLDGTKTKGAWKLIAADTDELAGGKLECFKLNFKYNPAN